MIEARPWDLGRKIIYRPNTQHALGGYKSPDPYESEEGVLVAIENQDYAIVKLHGDNEPRRARVVNLSWKDD